ncbi:MAG: outer membrane protein assembly factor, partial [Proteobacteria bacterium]|nr:outer membrane protein assembly factor [Pseudomonadota bacterium]
MAVAAWLAAAPGLLSPASAQTPPPAEPALDPDSPLDPLPGLGVDWPDLAAQPDAPVEAAGGVTADAGADLRYDIRFDGLDAEQLAKVSAQFNQLSTLKAGEKQPANVAQIDRRAREDADLLAELLRSYGYYDAAVEPRVATENGQVLVTLAATPGELYHFAEVQVRGLEGAPVQADALREAFGIKAQDPVDAAVVNAGTAAMRARIGQGGFPFAKVPDPEVVVDHESRTATLV